MLFNMYSVSNMDALLCVYYFLGGWGGGRRKGGGRGSNYLYNSARYQKPIRENLL